MSWKGSLRYWSVGPFSWHVYVHALDPRQRRFYELGIGLHEWQVWPPRSVLDPRIEWTVSTLAELNRLAQWCVKRIRNGEYSRGA